MKKGDLLYIKQKKAKTFFFSVTMKIKCKGISCKRWEKHLLAQTSPWQCISCFQDAGRNHLPSTDLTFKSCVWLPVDKIILNWAVLSCRILLYANKHLKIELNLEMALLWYISSPLLSHLLKIPFLNTDAEGLHFMKSPNASIPSKTAVGCKRWFNILWC